MQLYSRMKGVGVKWFQLPSSAVLCNLRTTTCLYLISFCPIVLFPCQIRSTSLFLGKKRMLNYLGQKLFLDKNARGSQVHRDDEARIQIRVLLWLEKYQEVPSYFGTFSQVLGDIFLIFGMGFLPILISLDTFFFMHGTS